MNFLDSKREQKSCHLFKNKQSLESFSTRYLSVSDSRKVSNFSFMFPHPFLISCFFFLSVKTCGKPHIQNIMSNVTAKPGQMATFKCQVDMSCIVAYIEWYHEMDNGTEKLIKVRLFQTFLCQLSITDCQLVTAILFQNCRAKLENGLENEMSF